MRAFAEIDLEAIGHNINEVRKNVGKDVKICAVIKSNAYGHGAIAVGHYLKDAVEYFAVAALDEAIELRESGITLPILILAYTSPSQYDDLIKYDITQTIYSYDTAKLLNDTAERAGKSAKIHIALDTGMTRIGFVMTDESIDEIEKISRLSHIELEGMFTHFACADMYDKSHTKMQMERYDSICDELDKRGVNIPIKHICNSAGVMEFDSHRFQMVRSGIITYGLYPSDEVDKSSMLLKPAMTFKSHVINVKTVDAGHGVSYGATYVTQSPTKIATISVGYADGYPRSLSNKGRVLIRGEFAPIIGRVCMDQIMVDVTHIDNVEIEDIVTLVGRDGENEIPVEEPANMAGSFNYEFICGLTNRVTRVY